MEPSSFDEANCVLGAPVGQEKEVDPLSVWRGVDGAGNPIVISCWKVTADELAKITETGRVWLWIFGNSMPPVIMSGEFPFEK